MRAAELRDRVVSVLAQHARVQFVRAFGADGARRRRGAAFCELTDELVEEQAPNGFRRARVAREERALHRFRKVRQRENGAIGVREIRRQRSGFCVRECFGGSGGEAHDGRVFYLACRARTLSSIDCTSAFATATRWATSITRCT